MKKKSSILFIIIIIFISFSFSGKRLTSISPYIPAQIPQYAYDPSSVSFSVNEFLRISNNLGDSWLKWEFTYSLSFTTPLTDGAYTTYINYFLISSGVYSSITGDSATPTIYPKNTIRCTSADVFHLNGGGYAQYYLLNSSATSFSGSGQMQVLWARYDSDGVVTDTSVSFQWGTIVYNLHMLLTLNSSYYNEQNCRILSYDKISQAWKVQSFNDIVLSHPEYKLKIVDLQNHVLFEDTDFQKFKYARTITLPSIKIENTASESIIVNITKNSRPYRDYEWYNVGDIITDADVTYGSPSIALVGGDYGHVVDLELHEYIQYYFSSSTELRFSAYFDSSGADWQEHIHIKNGYLYNYGTCIRFYNLLASSSHIVASGGVDAWHDFTFVSTSTALYIYMDGALATTISGYFVLDRFYPRVYASGCLYLDNLDFSAAPGFFSERATLFHDHVVQNETQVCPPYNSILFGDDDFDFGAWGYNLTFTDMAGNVLDTVSMSLDAGNITTSYQYVPPNMRECFISLADQQAQYLDWENYKIYVNDSQILSNTFYGEINATYNISIYSRFDSYLTETLHTVTRDSTNWIPITLTRYSLKLYNQQSAFLHYNITLDPNYHSGATVFWSEWLAPNEISSLALSPDYYKVEIMKNESGTPEYVAYSYYLDTDDILLISSSNTIAAVLYNLQNVNSSLSSQITNVEINITNQNSQINNTIVNVEINLDNVNSSLTNLLLNQNTTITAIGNNLTTLYIYQQEQFQIVQNNISTSFTELNNSIFLINNSIYTAVDSVSASLSNVNNSISGNLSIILQQNEELTELYIQTMFADYLDWTNASINADYVRNQTERVQILNQFRNQTAEVLFKYQGHVESLVTMANEQREQWIPRYGTEFRVKSIANDSYLTEWTPIPDNKTISFGYWEDSYTDVHLNAVSVGDLIGVLVMIAAAVSLFVYSLQKLKTQTLIKQKRRDFQTPRDHTATHNPIDSIRRKR